MTFDQALKTLAEKWPEKLKTFEIMNMLNFSTYRGTGWTVYRIVSRITQDDIDSILALIGWWIEVGRLCAYMKGTPDDPTEMDFKDMKKWAYYGQSEGGGTIDSYYEFPTKLSAAKAALIAITQEKSK